jgi:hypothetical protein
MSTSNNVGIGTTSPQGTVNGVALNGIVTIGAPQVQSGSDFYGNYLILNRASSNLYASMLGHKYLATAANSGLDFHVTENSDVSTSAPKMTIRSNGNVGIGTASPFGKLDVFGGAIISSNVTTFSHAAISMGNGEFLSIEAFNSGNTGKLPISLEPYGGSVGIGITNPQTTLDVNGTVNVGTWNNLGTAADNTTYGLERSRYTLQFPTYRDTMPYKIGAKIIAINKQTYISSTARSAIQSTDLAFFTTPPDTPYVDDSVERLRITDTGKVGIGTSSPGSALDGCLLDVYAGGTSVSSNVNISAGCNGSASSTNKASLVMNIKGAGGGIVNGAMTYQLLGSGNYGLNLQAYAGTSVLAINGNGRVGVNTTDPAVALHVNGNIRGSLGDMGPILLVMNTAKAFNVGDTLPFLEEGAGTTDYYAYFGAAYSVNPGNASGDGGSWSQWRLIIRYRGGQDFTPRSGTARNVEYHNTPAGNNYTATYNISDSGGVRGCNTIIGPWQTLQNADVPGLGWNLISWTSGQVIVGSVHVQFKA